MRIFGIIAALGGLLAAGCADTPPAAAVATTPAPVAIVTVPGVVKVDSVPVALYPPVTTPPKASQASTRQASVIITPKTVHLAWTPNYMASIPAPYNAEVTGIVASGDLTQPQTAWPTIWTGATNNVVLPWDGTTTFYGAYNTWTNL